jgi:hypothetical protein
MNWFFVITLIIKHKYKHKHKHKHKHKNSTKNYWIRSSRDVCHLRATMEDEFNLTETNATSTHSAKAQIHDFHDSIELMNDLFVHLCSSKSHRKMSRILNEQFRCFQILFNSRFYQTKSVHEKAKWQRSKHLFHQISDSISRENNTPNQLWDVRHGISSDMLIASDLKIFLSDDSVRWIAEQLIIPSHLLRKVEWDCLWNSPSLIE